MKFFRNLLRMFSPHKPPSLLLIVVEAEPPLLVVVALQIIMDEDAVVETSHHTAIFAMKHIMMCLIALAGSTRIMTVRAGLRTLQILQKPSLWAAICQMIHLQIGIWIPEHPPI